MSGAKDHPSAGAWRLYGRRKGPKLSARQTQLRCSLLAKVAFNPSACPFSQFPNDVQQIWLEVGFGAGEHLIWQAAHHPHVGLIGAEAYTMGVAKLLSKLDNSNLNNVRIYEGDGRNLLATLPESSLGRFFLLFPDPWPKTRHHKRRLLQSHTLDLLARVMGSGAELRFATDDLSYLNFALEQLRAHPAFEWVGQGGSDWKERPGDWPPTRYEAKAIDGPPRFLRLRRRDKTSYENSPKIS